MWLKFLEQYHFIQYGLTFSSFCPCHTMKRMWPYWLTPQLLTVDRVATLLFFWSRLTAPEKLTTCYTTPDIVPDRQYECNHSIRIHQLIFTKTFSTYYPISALHCCTGGRGIFDILHITWHDYDQSQSHSTSAWSQGITFMPLMS